MCVSKIFNCFILAAAILISGCNSKVPGGRGEIVDKGHRRAGMYGRIYLPEKYWIKVRTKGVNAWVKVDEESWKEYKVGDMYEVNN